MDRKSFIYKFMKIIESPRDEIQGILDFIPTYKKIEYIKSLLSVGFDTIDFGSFVSPKAIPQMKDSEEVVENLDLSNTKTKLSVIIPNKRGVETAIKYEQIKYLGFLFSVSETFLHRNINSNIEKTIENFLTVKELSDKYDKKIIVNVSMAFGNPYGDLWNIDILDKYVNYFSEHGVEIITLADTVGMSTPDTVFNVFDYLISKYPNTEFGFHLHSEKDKWYDRIDSAYKAGVARFESTLGGFGGCPAALLNGVLINNLKTNNLVNYCKEKDILLDIDYDKLTESEKIFNSLFI